MTQTNKVVRSLKIVNEYLYAALPAGRLPGSHPAVHGKKYSSPSLRRAAAKIGKPEKVIRTDMEDLVSSGDVLLLPGGMISLTGKGKQTGESVIKKHETLQCFLSEILGMDNNAASDEACTLEHAVSDETIDRLGRLIVKQEGQRHQREAGKGEATGPVPYASEDCDCVCPSISDCEEGEQVIIHCIHGRACAKRLLDLWHGTR